MIWDVSNKRRVGEKEMVVYLDEGEMKKWKSCTGFFFDFCLWFVEGYGVRCEERE